MFMNMEFMNGLFTLGLLKQEIALPINKVILPYIAALQAQMEQILERLPDL